MVKSITLAACCCFISGCGFQAGRIEVPELLPQEVASRFVEDYDRDDNGVLSADECAACPPLAAAFARYDADQDGRLSTDEISARLQAMVDSRIGRMPCILTIYLNGKPLNDARIELVPEESFSGAIQNAIGTTNDTGVATPVTVDAPPGVPGAQFGLYRIKISHPSVEIPSEYNNATTLGFELSPLERDGDTAEFRITAGTR